MEFIHPHFAIKIDTESEDFIKKKKELEVLYNKIPATICNFCPKKKEVEADCCKHFSPPMYLLEFLNVFEDIDKLKKDQKIELIVGCVKSFLNPDIVRPCVLLNGILCSVYKSRPFSCRFYGQYPKAEWKKRLETISSEWGIPVDDIPMKDQCGKPNVTYEKNNQKPIGVKKENDIFKDIAKLDVKLFSDKKIGESIVYSSKTYLPFDMHYLLLMMGPDYLEELASIKILLINKKEGVKNGSSDPIDLMKFEKEVKDFIQEFENSLRLNTVDTESGKNSKGLIL